ncbi:hypothetical protein [Domibacillus robiginosus]|uniref:hypothetical protein n=1 Tax=Domibacillus robiginosus TaxID=1071054 RepID=UPI0012E08B89|nr:hypothetical protein [Domibacillus robiginosus]
MKPAGLRVPRAVRELPRLAPAGSPDSLYFPQESMSGRLHQALWKINKQRGVAIFSFSKETYNQISSVQFCRKPLGGVRAA